MKKLCCLAILFHMAFTGPAMAAPDWASLPDNVQSGGKPMRILKIRWQRLVNAEGQTCDRCGETGTEVQDAVDKLARALKEVGIEVALEKLALSQSEFSKDTLQSNRIWMGGEPLETLLSATPGKSRCCSACGDADCRTLTVGGKTYETIPSELIVKAGLIAGAGLLGGETASPCCPEPEPKKAELKPCQPSSPCGNSPCGGK
jgi:hypothetical protein